MDKNTLLYEEARQLMPGGVSAGGRKNRIYGQPIYLDHADGCRLYSVDGDVYLDYHCCAGASLFGYNHPRLKAAAQKVLEKGFFMNFDSELTVEFARLFTRLVPTAEQIRFTNSGSEATLAAIRLARGYTGRDLIIRMDGHFHGMQELIWFNHGSFPEIDQWGEVVETVPDSAGIPKSLGDPVKVIRFNDIQAVENVVAKYQGRIAAIMLEPVSYNCGCLEAELKYLQKVREICSREGILLIFDEVITGLRFSPGSAQLHYGVKPDISTFAKAISNGFPLALVAGTKEVMQTFNPTGPVVCSGTCSGTQMAVAVGIECLRMALEKGFYERIDKTAEVLYGGIGQLFKKHSLPGHVRGRGAQFGMYFGYDDPNDDFDIRKSMAQYDMQMGKRFIAECLKEGIYFHYYGDQPYPPHCGFSTQHTAEDIGITLEKFERIFARLAEGGKS